MVKDNLPKNWQVKTLGEVCEITMGQSPKGEQVFLHNKISSCHSDLECNEREESQKDSTLRDISATPQYDNTKIDNDFMEFHQGKICFTDKYISESEFVTTDIKKIAEKDSILLCVRAPVGIINITKRKVAIGRGLCALKMKNQNNDFLYFYLLTLENYFNQKATGSTFSAITMNVVKNTPIPLPPLETQKAIVEKLENAFAHIDEAVRHLKAVQTNIPRLKSSLLHCAFSGKFTESPLCHSESPLCHSEGEARRISKDSTLRDISGFALNMTNGGVCHSKPLADEESKPSCHTEPLGEVSYKSNKDISYFSNAQYDKPTCHSEALVEESQEIFRYAQNDKGVKSQYDKGDNLPQDWEVKTLGEVCEKIQKRSKNYQKTEFDYIDISSINNKTNMIEKTEKYDTAKAPSRAQQIIQSNDILFSNVRTYLKNIAFVEEKYNNCIASTGFCVIRTKKDILLPKFMFYQVLSDKFISPLNMLQRGSSYPAVRDSDVLSQIVVMPPLETQNQIVQILESKFTHLEKLAQFVNASLENLQRLKSSLLSQAFKGELVC